MMEGTGFYGKMKKKISRAPTFSEDGSTRDEGSFDIGKMQIFKFYFDIPTVDKMHPQVVSIR